MKLIHTPLGALASKKKVIAGVAALALVGGITPVLINNTHAKEILVEPSTTTETLYTTVGPQYFTVTDLYVSDYSDYNIRVADTSVADLYGYSLEEYDVLNTYNTVRSAATSAPASRSVAVKAGDIGSYFPVNKSVCSQYICLQGKKIGETELILEGEHETLRYPVVSVKLTPNAITVESTGKEIKGEGSIDGADNSLLKLRNVLTNNRVSGMQTGERSYSLYSSTMMSSANLVWTIGNQQVGGGTGIMFMPITGIDNIAHSEENEVKLENAFKNVLVKLMVKFMEAGGPSERQMTIVTDNGDVAHIIARDSSGRLNEFKVTLGSEDVASNSANNIKTSLFAALPEDSKDKTFKDVSTNINFCYSPRESEAAAFYSVSSELEEMPYSSETICVESGYFEKLNENLDFALDVSDVEAVKDGYTRKWSVARYNNGKAEAIDATYDEKTKTLRFSSNIFGYYAYSYVDEKEETPVTPKVPNTGIAPAKVATTAAATILPVLTIAGIAFMIRSKKHADSKLAKKHEHFE